MVTSSPSPPSGSRRQLANRAMKRTGFARRLSPGTLGGRAMKWEPISEADLKALVARDLARASSEQEQFFGKVAVPPTKWVLSPWGDLGGGFWVVALLEDRVLWYNDIEDGFNVSRFATLGTIPDGEYWCNQDELRWALDALAGKSTVKIGALEPASNS
jgi:hypothetical protein